jgi:hypothetical protein
MTVRAVRRREMGDTIPPQRIPSDDAPVPPYSQMQEQNPMMGQPQMGNPQMGAPAPNDQLVDHTHPEYDQAMVKLQEIEGELSDMRMGGVDQQESVDATPLEDVKKIKEPHSDKFPISQETLRRMIREELQGVPERDITKKQENPESAAADIPQTAQPANGEAPSGGGFDSNDKKNKEDADAAAAKVPKPASEYPRPTVHQNKMKLAKKYLERAKRLMRESSEDPTEPQPGESQKDPNKMDGSAANKNPIGGTETLDDEELRKDLVGTSEELDDLDEEEEKEEKKPDFLQERRSRQSIVGMSGGKYRAEQEDFLDVRSRASASIKEYLQKAGHGRALNMMQ